MQIGIYGGTFNPIHIGHLRVAEEIKNRFKLREVIFVPASDPPHKDGRDIIDPLHRLKMVNLAVTGNAGFSASEVELKRRGKSYSIDTVRQLQEIYADCDLAFIMGLDAFLEIDTWHKYTEILNTCDIIVTSRPGIKPVSPAKAIPEAVRDQYKRKRSGKEFIHESGRKLVFTSATRFRISSSMIRDLVRKGESIRYLLPRRVMEYIIEHQLYIK